MNKNTTTLALASLLTSFAVGCGSVEDPSAPAEDLMDDVPEVPVTPPTPEARATSCAEIHAALPAAPDGEYTLYLDGDAAKPWSAYCHDMTSGAKEYLTLNSTGAGTNQAMYAAGGAAPGTDVVTKYFRVRIDPASLAIQIGDQTFAHSTGSLIHSGIPVTSMPFGVAMSCGGAIGRANVDLTGTPFIVVDAFAVVGSGAAGDATWSADQRSVAINGEGFCGWNGPALAPFNPMNNASGELVLDYQR